MIFQIISLLHRYNFAIIVDTRQSRKSWCLISLLFTLEQIKIIKIFRSKRSWVTPRLQCNRHIQAEIAILLTIIAVTCLLHPKILLYPSSSFSVFLAVVITNKSPSSIFNHLRVINFISFKRSDDCLFQVSFLHVQLFICNLFYKVFTSCIWQLMLETSKQISKNNKKRYTF